MCLVPNPLRPAAEVPDDGVSAAPRVAALRGTKTLMLSRKDRAFGRALGLPDRILSRMP